MGPSRIPLTAMFTTRMTSVLPNKEQALAFAIMLQAGLPASDAIRFFSDSEDPAELASLVSKWLRSKALAGAQNELLGKPWQGMTIDEQVKTALNYSHAGMAYYLFSRNYSELGQSDQSKYNAARQALEARQAGTLGKSDPLSRFMDEFVARKLGSKGPEKV
jgi:hypothetical protein